MLDAEIIAVGSEMLSSGRVDTNSLFLTDQLNGFGVEIRRKHIVGDHLALLTETVRQAIAPGGIVILTGGLGPTEDDLTRDAVAAALGRQTHLDEAVLQGIERRFTSRGRKMAPTNIRQAYIVEGAEVLENAHGTAPGQWIRLGNSAILMLPGPPREMQPMFRDQVVPRLAAMLPATIIRTRFYRVTGLTESDLDHLIAPAYKDYVNPVTTILASTGDIQIHLRARCDEASGGETEAERLLAEVGGAIEKILGDRIYSTNGESLEVTVARLLKQQGATVAVAESLTGGMLAQRITSVAGSSTYFLGGLLTYTDRMKSELLGVDPALIAQHTAVSRPVAQAMAEGAAARTGADFAIATTGEAGPESSTGAPVGTVFVGIAGGMDTQGRPQGSTAHRFSMPGDRERVRGFTVNAALDLLRRRLASLE